MVIRRQLLDSSCTLKHLNVMANKEMPQLSPCLISPSLSVSKHVYKPCCRRYIYLSKRAEFGTASGTLREPRRGVRAEGGVVSVHLASVQARETPGEVGRKAGLAVRNDVTDNLGR